MTVWLHIISSFIEQIKIPKGCTKKFVANKAWFILQRLVYQLVKSILFENEKNKKQTRFTLERPTCRI